MPENDTIYNAINSLYLNFISSLCVIDHQHHHRAVSYVIKIEHLNRTIQPTQPVFRIEPRAEHDSKYPVRFNMFIISLAGYSSG